MPEKMETKAFIWNLSNPNEYELELHAPSPVTNMSYNHKNVDILGGGCYNGLLAFWDYRKGSAATNISPVELSHADPITHF
jgi:dynein intermediate chain 2